MEPKRKFEPFWIKQILDVKVGSSALSNFLQFYHKIKTSNWVSTSFTVDCHFGKVWSRIFLEVGQLTRSLVCHVYIFKVINATFCVLNVFLTLLMCKKPKRMNSGGCPVLRWPGPLCKRPVETRSTISVWLESIGPKGKMPKSRSRRSSDEI